ncbi:hypothetical protein L7F22_020525 [Adiantum nelumboides]|nr:hypothetical protein [Adiantum nelumboides]
MGTYQHVEEIWRKKQYDVMYFLLQVRCWEFRQLPGIVCITLPTHPDKPVILAVLDVEQREWLPLPMDCTDVAMDRGSLD